MKKRILYIAQEILPYVEDSIVAEGSLKLPLEMQPIGHDLRIFMPRYGLINERRHQLHEVIRLSGLNLIINDKMHQLVVKVASLMPQRMQVYFIENDDFFSRKGSVMDKKGTLYEDNVERSVFFIRGVFETIKKLRWIPDVIHCQGWFAGLAPLYLRTMLDEDPIFANSKIVFSAYDQTPDIPFGVQLTEVLKFDGIEHTKLDGTALSREDLVELILDYSDGMVILSDMIGKQLHNAIIKSQIPHLDLTNKEQWAKEVDEFYESLERRVIQK